MKYIFPTIINQRRIHFFDLKKNNSKIQETFVAEISNIVGEIDLITIDKNKYLQTLEIGKKDISINDLNIDCTFQNDMLKITLSEKNTEIKEDNLEKNTDEIEENIDWKKIEINDIKPEKKEKIKELEFKNSLQEFKLEDNLVLCARDHKSEWKLGLQILSELNQNIEKDHLLITIQYLDYKENFVIHLAASTSFVHCGLDFGSESSQLSHQFYSYFAGQNIHKEQECHLFNMMKSLYGKKGDNKEFIQFEKNSNFLKSLFFVQKNMKSTNEEFTQSDFLNYDSNLNLITHRTEVDNDFSNKYIQLPNLKLAHKHGDLLRDNSFTIEIGNKEVERTLEDLREKIYATIIKQISKSYVEDLLLGNQNKIYLRFTLLVPNIYSSQDLAASKHILFSILDEFNKNEANNQLGGWEIETLSESDASFLGYYNTGKRTTKNGQYYIIIDCGKGTTDFSVIHTDNKKRRELKPLYRNGFAGAGNLITYSFFESVLSFLIENAQDKNKAKSFLRNVFQNMTLLQSLELFEIMERLKINYDENYSKEQMEKEWNQIKKDSVNFKYLFNELPDIDSLFEMLKKAENAYDYGMYVHKTLENISSNIVENLKEILQELSKTNECGGILLTGRAFLFKPLYNILQEKIKQNEYLKNTKIEEMLSAENLKKICMAGIFTKSFVVNPEMVGFPIQVKLENEENVELKKEEHKTSKNPMDWLKKITHWIALGGELYDEDKNSFALQSNDFINTNFIMGNSLYYVDHSSFYDIEKVKNIDLIFTKEGYFVRSKNDNGIIEIISNLRRKNDIDNFAKAYIIPSMFPAKIDLEFIVPLNISYAQNSFSDFLPL